MDKLLPRVSRSTKSSSEAERMLLSEAESTEGDSMSEDATLQTISSSESSENCKDWEESVEDERDLVEIKSKEDAVDVAVNVGDESGVDNIVYIVEGKRETSCNEAPVRSLYLMPSNRVIVITKGMWGKIVLILNLPVHNAVVVTC